MIETKRLILRPIQKSDAQELFDYRSDTRENEFQGWVPKSIKDVKAFIESNPKNLNESNTWFQLVMIQKETNLLIGDIGLHFVGNDGFQCEIGYTVNKKYHNNGFATEAMKAVVNYLFEDLKKHRVYASTDPRNLASIRVLEKMNFKREAHFKESLYFKGEWVDDVIYGILSKEWLK